MGLVTSAPFSFQEGKGSSESSSYKHTQEITLDLDGLHMQGGPTVVCRIQPTKANHHSVSINAICGHKQQKEREPGCHVCACMPGVSANVTVKEILCETSWVSTSYTKTANSTNANPFFALPETIKNLTNEHMCVLCTTSCQLSQVHTFTGWKINVA